MKLQLDVENKVIKIEEDVNLGEFVKILKKLLPAGKWKEFKLETQIVLNDDQSADFTKYSLIPWEAYCYNNNLS